MVKCENAQKSPKIRIENVYIWHMHTRLQPKSKLNFLSGLWNIDYIHN